MGSVCKSVVSHGADGVIIDIQCHISNNLPTIVIVGFAGRAVNEARDRLRGAFASSTLQLPRKRITINLAPADLPKSESSLDLGMAAAILASQSTAYQLAPQQAVIGELGLDGSVRPVRGIIGKLLSARNHGLCSFFVPVANLEQARLIPGIELLPVASLWQFYQHMNGQEPIIRLQTGDGRSTYSATTTAPQSTASLNEVIGQDGAKRALIIAAAGGHNLFLTGPPGSGKSMLAKTLPQLLPPMSHEETLEVTHLSSLANYDYDQLSHQRPLRSPHHSTSFTAMVGGGQHLRPGEISLSHRGVLFLDEFPEFSRQTLEALRQPMEDKVISVVRTKSSTSYPANFMLIATANPCPCGFFNFSPERCKCNVINRKRYQNKLSGPIMDRIDLCADVHAVDHKRLLGSLKSQYSHEESRQRIEHARSIQAVRHGSSTILNSDLTNRQLRQFAQLNRAATIVMQDAAHNLQLSARSYMRTIKVARTIADLEDCPAISGKHLSEALSYRQRPSV